jgi:glutamate carboxypeptidase
MTDPDLLALARRDEKKTIDLIRELVALSSPSTDKVLVDRLVARVAAWLDGQGLSPRLERRPSVGDIVWGEWPGQDGRILVLCHLDTVWPESAAQANPFRIDDGRIYGPGVFDMKGPVALTLRLQEYLRDGTITPRRSVRFLYTTDEETGSFESRALIEEFARESDIALVLEPPLPGGGLKAHRKGSGVYQIEVVGRSAHAGLEPEKGVNAILEMAAQVERLPGLADLRNGTTVTPTLIQGGTGLNVVPDRVSATIDVRFWSADEGARIDAALRALTPVDPNAQVHVSGQIDRPPMIASPKTEELAAQAREIAAKFGVELWAGKAGGGSDGNFTAAQGAPTLDGLGLEGGGAHARDEHVLLSSIAPRLAVLARLIEKL